MSAPSEFCRSSSSSSSTPSETASITDATAKGCGATCRLPPPLRIFVPLEMCPQGFRVRVRFLRAMVKVMRVSRLWLGVKLRLPDKGQRLRIDCVSVIWLAFRVIGGVRIMNRAMVKI